MGALLSLPLSSFAAGAPAIKPLKPAEPEKARKVREFPGEPVQIKSSDGWTLSAQYLPAREGQRTFVLLHEAGGNKQNWYWFVRKMKARGLGALALDLRGHGLSQSAPEGQESNYRKFKAAKENNDWDNIREDITASVEFLKEKGVDPATVALGGAAVGGSVAIRYAALHPEVPMVFLLSPGMSHQGLPTINAVRAYKQRPLLFVVGDDDKRSAAEIPILFEFAKRAAGAENVFLLRVPKGHGTRLLVFNRGLMDGILDWTDTPTAAPTLQTAASTTTAPGAVPARREPGDDLPSEEEMDQQYGVAPRSAQ